MRYFRLLFGALAVVFALWVIIGEQISLASSNAFINAPLVTVRSDVAGTVSLPDRVLGARIREGEQLAQVEDPLVDAVRLDDLRTEGEIARAEIARHEAHLTELREMLTAQTERAAIFTEARLEELREELAEARLRLDIVEATDGAGDADAEQVRLLDSLRDDEAGITPLGDRSEALAESYARERVTLLETALEAAEQGVFLGDGYNDAPFAEQFAAELRARIAAAEAELGAARARAEAIASRVTREEARVNVAGSSVFLSPVDGVLWETFVSDGTSVQRGDPLLELVDCGAAFVSLSVRESVYNALSIGQEASFRLNGDARLYPATVSRLAGSGARRLYDTLAVTPSEEHLQRYDVTLLVPGLSEDTSLDCAVGKTGRVFFDGRPLDWFRGLVN